MTLLDIFSNASMSFTLNTLRKKLKKSIKKLMTQWISKKFTAGKKKEIF